MSVNLGAISGVIELQDDFTGPLGIAKAALGNFTKENQESLTAVAGAAGIVVAAITAVGAATLALGNRGADVNDLRTTIEQFAGGAEAAEAAMEGLRKGTLQTVDDFDLAKEAAHLLSAGVKLTAEDFNTLGSAAFVLQNRGLGDTATQLKLVSDAMITGRTRALAMAVGVVEVKDAEAAYAATLGITKDQLSEAGKVQAKRIEIMRIMKEAVKGAGDQERDFGEQLEAAQVFITNWIDDLASAVAESKVFSAGMKAIGDAVSQAFGGDQEDSIRQVVSALEDGAIFAVNFGLGAVEAARVVHTAWSLIETTILGVMTGIAKGVETLASFAGVSKDTQVQLEAMASSLAAQTDEAARGVTQTSEFDATLDKLGGTLFTIKDAMNAAKDATVENNDVVDVATENAKKLAAAEATLAASAKERMIDQEKMSALLEKTNAEIETLYAQHYALRVKMSGNSYDAQRAQIEADFKEQAGKLDKLNPLYQKHYEALRANADAALDAVASDWDSVKDKSIEALQEQAKAARETYNQMQSGTEHFTREVLEEQRRKVEDLEAEARGLGESYSTAFQNAATAAKVLTDELKAQEEAARKAKEANRAMGGSLEVTRENFAATARGMGLNEAAIETLLKKGYSFQQAVLWSQHLEWPPPENPGPRVAGFARGGTITSRDGVALVGEEGPELVQLPTGSQVFPTGTAPGVSGGGITNIFHVNGTAQDVAKQISRIIMRDLKSHRQFGTA